MNRIYSNSFSLCFARSAAALFAGGVEGTSTAGSPKKTDVGPIEGPFTSEPFTPAPDGCILGRDLDTGNEKYIEIALYYSTLSGIIKT